MEKQFLKPIEVAEIFNISVITIYKLARENKIPHFRIGGSIRFIKKDLIKSTKIDHF